METPRDAVLWKKAKKRAAFKIHLRTYLIINAGLWLLYFFTHYPNFNPIPWPVFPMLGWGIGLGMHYFTAYGNLDEDALAKREYERLVRE
ncbi:2TM domain-containing protein [Dyadobacter aurulentus]|uniref:2TM domain-containing protein n=1 Tax=Dyadobacter sp. UC 10 TaxID=2605428 RepID=UPI0011F0D344|nr:2TM domain-containing protein [Dyadobacter sp. UC 10]KAA0989619.1 2TM domain-containing protein [Dyadobacter sp. UC 10]